MFRDDYHFMHFVYGPDWTNDYHPPRYINFTRSNVNDFSDSVQDFIAWLKRNGHPPLFYLRSSQQKHTFYYRHYSWLWYQFREEQYVTALLNGV